MEFSSEDRTRAWALIVRLAARPAEPFVFKAKSLDPRRAYRLTCDNTGKTETVKSGATVAIGVDQESELLLFERR